MTVLFTKRGPLGRTHHRWYVLGAALVSPLVACGASTDHHTCAGIADPMNCATATSDFAPDQIQAPLPSGHTIETVPLTTGRSLPGR